MLKKLLFFVIFFLFITKTIAHGVMHLGQIHFETSGTKEAQLYFKEGVMLLHSFEYNDARDAFLKAQKVDSSFAMAYWGEAMSYNHPLWNEQDFMSGVKALNRLAATAAGRVSKAKTQKEKGLIKAINALYGNGNKRFRDTAYAKSMCQLYRNNPSDDEIASFYALALLGSAEGQRDFRIYMQAAGIVEEIYGRNSQHPGALHYAIHSYDDPIHAPLGLRAARAYARMAPDASHALHMPSHIFLALGMWDDVISSNKAAWESGIKKNKVGDAAAYTIDDLHALEWLSYGYLQKRQYRQAYELTKIMEGIAERSNSAMTKWYYALMRSSYIAATHVKSIDLKPMDMSGIELSARSTDMYTNGLLALRKGNINGAKSILKQLENLISLSKMSQVTYKSYFTSVTSSGLMTAKIVALEMKAQIELMEDKKQQSLAHLKRAVDMENKTSFGYGPPIPAVPSYELLAQQLLRFGQYDKAYRVALVGLKRMPNRIKSQEILAKAEAKLKSVGLSVPEGIEPYFNKLMLPEYYQ